VAGGEYTPTSNLNHEVAFAEIWNGATWQLTKPAAVNTTYNFDGFFSISCPSTTFCLLGGEYASSVKGYFTTLVERLSGTTWTRLTDAAITPQSGYATYINSISCTSSTSCVAVGEQDKYSAATVWHGFAETYNGSTWTRYNAGLTTSSESNLDAVSCATSSYCIAVGGVGTYAHTLTGKAIFSIWNGTTWTLHYANPPTGQGNFLQGVTCLASNYCVASGGGGTYNTDTSHGLTWFWNGGKFTLINTA
jgi:hypothetical protein